MSLGSLGGHESFNDYTIQETDKETFHEAVKDSGGTIENYQKIKSKDQDNPKADQSVSFTQVSVKGLKKLLGPNSAKGDWLFTGETSQLKKTLQKSNTIAQHQLGTLNLKFEDVSSRLKKMGENAETFSELESRLKEIQIKLKSDFPETLIKGYDGESPHQETRASLKEKESELEEQIKIIKEKSSLTTKIESRERLITNLDSATIHGQLKQGVKKAGKFVLDTVAQSVGAYVVYHLPKVALKTASKKIGSAALSLQASYKQKFHQIPKAMSYAINNLKKDISETGVKGAKFNKGSYEDFYKEQVQAMPPELRGEFDRHVRTHGNLLTLAFFKEDLDAQQFLLDKGLFTVTPTMLKAIENLTYQSGNDRKEVFKKLFKNCHDPEDLSKIVAHLRSKGEMDFAKDLVKESLSRWKEAPDDLSKVKYERCRMLVPIFGDSQLFKMAFDVDPSKLYQEGASSEEIAAARKKFLESPANSSLLMAQTKGGQNIMHHACLSNDPAGVQFLSEVTYQHNDQMIKDLKKTKDNLRTLLNYTKAPAATSAASMETSIVELERMAESLDSRQVKMQPHSKSDLAGRLKSGLESPAIQKRKNSLVSHLPVWMRKDDSMQALVESHHSISQEMNQNPNQASLQKKLQNIERQIEFRLTTSIIGLEGEKNPFAMRDKNFVQAKNGMSMKLANGLDRLNKFKGNEKGSFSNMVGHRQFMEEGYSKKEIAFLVGTTIIGKWIGCLGPTHMLVTEADMGLVKEVVDINAPLFAVGGVGFLTGMGLIHAYRKHKANKMGMDTSLSQSSNRLKELTAPRESTVVDAASLSSDLKVGQSTKKEKIDKSANLSPTSQLKKALKNRNLAKVEELLLKDSNPSQIKVSSGLIKAFSRMHYFESDQQKQNLLMHLCERCDQRNIFKLLDKQLLAGDRQVVEKIVSEHIKEENVDSERYKGLLQLAAKLGNRELLLNVIEKGKAMYGNTDFLLKTIEPKSGDTLLHLAMATKDISIVTLVADELIQASKKTGVISFERPRTGIFKKFRSANKMTSMKYGKDIFELTNPKTGKTIVESPYFDKTMASQLDDAYGLSPDKMKEGIHSAKGTFTQLYDARNEKHRMVLAAEISGVLPFKGVLNLLAGEYIKDITLQTFKLASHVLTGGASLVVTTCVEFLTGCAVMAFGFSGGFVIGALGAHMLFQMQMKRKGLESSATKLANEHIPDEQLRARYAHGRRKALRELKKEKLTDAECNELRKAFKKTFDQQVKELHAAGEPDTAKEVDQLSGIFERSLKPGRNKQRVQKALTEAVGSPETMLALCKATSNRLKADASAA